MLMNNHKMIADYILDNMRDDRLHLINRKRFIWGNIKPDCASRYKFKKHYYNESIDMVVEMIEKLSSLSISEINNESSIGKFSGVLGVVCHFLTDYYCLPHYQRWEFKNAMRPHVVYERELSKVSKNYKVNVIKNNSLKPSNIREFIDGTLEIYAIDQSFENDLNFAYYVCSSIFDMIIESVVQNEININNRIAM
ncbi:MAG: zinc dependent phospholipase C family protein [Clostridium sp.]|uniref:zinc dependent phospholipase C family protein n=2 Tax=Clostridium sp. TaxID=1506 RepID=UPI002FC8A04B